MNDDLKNVLSDFEYLLKKKHEPPVAIALLGIAAIHDLSRSVLRISHGDVSGPTGLEGLAMAIGGRGLRCSLRESVEELASAAREIAEAVDRKGGR